VNAFQTNRNRRQALTAQSGPAHALTMTECSAKYKEAKSAGTLNGMIWNDFLSGQKREERPALTNTG
jgi:hypothetical protein